MYITLDLAKQHLNLESSYTEDDEYLMLIVQVAEEAVRQHVNEDLDKIAEKNGGCIPAPLFQAMMLMIGNLYQNREMIGSKAVAGAKNIELPFNYRYLIDLYRNFNK